MWYIVTYCTWPMVTSCLCIPFKKGMGRPVWSPKAHVWMFWMTHLIYWDGNRHHHKNASDKPGWTAQVEDHDTIWLVVIKNDHRTDMKTALEHYYSGSGNGLKTKTIETVGGKTVLTGKEHSVDYLKDYVLNQPLCWLDICCALHISICQVSKWVLAIWKVLLVSCCAELVTVKEPGVKLFMAASHDNACHVRLDRM